MNQLQENIIQKIRVPYLMVLKIYIKNESLSINTIVLHLNKDKTYSIESILPEKDNLASVFSTCRKRIPLLLNISGDGVLNKSISIRNINDFSVENIPEFKNNDLMVNSYQTEDYILYAFARIDKINTIVANVESYGHKVLETQVGYPGLLHIEEHLEKQKMFIIDETVVSISNNKLVISNGINLVQESEINVNGELLSSSQLLALLSAKLFLLTDSGYKRSNLINDSSKYKWYKLTRRSAIISAGLVLLLLCGGLFLRSYSIRYSDEIKAESHELKKIRNEISNLTTRLTNAGRIIYMNNYDRTTLFSFYSDRIASVAPIALSLTQMTIFPGELNKRTGDWNSQDRVVLIKGIVEDLGNLTGYVESLDSLEWTNEAKVLNYSRNEKSLDGQFEITVYLSEE